MMTKIKYLLIMFVLMAIPANAEWINQATITAYTPLENTMLMANGDRVYEGAVAHCTLPFGTKVIIDGQTYIVTDRTGTGDENHFDIFMFSYDKAIQFGRRSLDVYIVRDGEL